MPGDEAERELLRSLAAALHEEDTLQEHRRGLLDVHMAQLLEEGPRAAAQEEPRRAWLGLALGLALGLGLGLGFRVRVRVRVSPSLG